MEELDKYIGKTIKEFVFTKKVLTFVFEDDETLELYAQGGCCSKSWFEQIAGEESLEKGAILYNVEFININDVIDSKDNDEYNYNTIKYYGIKFKTSLGYADIDMRNSSNGYYGGFISINIDDQYTDLIVYPN